MLRLVSDQNFSGPVLRGIRRQVPDVDSVRALDVELDRASDDELLEWAASEERILLTHDVNTITAAAYDRRRLGHARRVPGAVVDGDWRGYR